MTIYVKSSAVGCQEVLTGHHRLHAMLEVHGKAWVYNTSTNEQLEVHEVGGQLVTLTPGAVAAVKSAAATAISNAAKP